MDINQIGILAQFSASGFAGSVSDKEVADEVTRSHSTESDVYKVSKKLFPSSTCGKVNAYTEIRKFIGQTRDRHYKATLPFDECWQLLPLAGHEEHDEAMIECERRLKWEFIANLRRDYDSLVVGARRAHNGTFDPALYPPVNEFVARFSIRHEYRPVPSGASMASMVFSARMDTIRADLEADNALRLKEAVSATWSRLLEPVIDLAQRLADPTTRRLAGIVGNVREIADRIPALNLTGDTNLTQASERIVAILAGVDSAALNENATLRGEVASSISAVAAQFGNIGGRKIAS